MASKDTPKKQKKHDLRTTHPGEEERETDFGTDQEVPRKHSQGASPNPEHRRPTYKSMKHKVFKTFGLEKSSSASQAVVENQESTKDDAGVSDFSNMITQLKTSPGNERKRLAMPNRTETKSEPTLVVGGDKSISQDDDDDVKQEVGVQVVTVHPLSQDETSSFRSSSLSAASNIEPIGSYVSEEMEESCTLRGQMPEPQIKEERARRKSKEAKTFQLVPKLKAKTKKLSNDLLSAQLELRQKQSAVEELQEKLSSKSKDLEELKAKLDKRDMDHERHITEKANELKAMHQQREISLDDLLKQEKQTRAHQLKEVEKEYHKLLNKKEKSCAGLLEKEQKEHQVEFEKKEALTKVKYEAAVKDTVAKEKEVQGLQLIIQEKQRELTLSNYEKDKLQQEVDATKQQQEEYRKETTSKISSLEQQLHKAEDELEIQIDKKQKELNSQHEQQVRPLKMQAKTQLDEAKAELDEANARIKRLNEKLHIQVQEIKTQTHGASTTEDEVMEGIELETVTVVLNEQDREQPCLLEAQVKENNCQAQDTIIELKDEQEQRIQDVIIKAKEDQEKLYEQLKSDYDKQLLKLMDDHRKEIEMLKEIKQPQAEKASQYEDLTSEVVAQPQLSKTETGNYMPDPVINHTSAVSNDVECVIQEIAELKEENKGLTEQLTSRDEMIKALQSKNDQLNEKYEQLEVQARAKLQVSKSTSSKENNDLHSSFVEATNQIAKIVSSEAIFGVAKERDITIDASVIVAKTLGLGKQPKPLSYVFAVFPASQRRLSVLLDYTEQEEVKDADEYHLVANQKALETHDNRTDAEKLRVELEKLTKKAELEAEAYQKKVDKLKVQMKELTKKVSEISATNAHLQEVVKTALEEIPPSASGIQAGDLGKTAKMLQQIRAKYLELSMQVVTTREDHEKQIEEYKVKLTEWQKRYNRKEQELTEKIIEKDNQLKQQCRDDGPPTTSFSSAEFHTPSKEISKQVEELRATLKIRDEEVQSLNAKVEAFQEVASQRQKLHEHSRTHCTVVAQLRKDLEESKHELARSQSLVASLRTKSKLPQLGTDDQDELRLLKEEAELFQIELTELRRKAESSKKLIKSLGKLKLSLERKLKRSNEEREELARENMELHISKHTIQGQLNKFGDLKTQVEATQENNAVLVQTVVTKTEENEDLQQKIKELEDELEVTKFQTFQYEQDFKEERQAREQAVGAKDSDFHRFTLQAQTLTEQLEMAKFEAENERKEKQAVISKLEAIFIDSQELKGQLKQAQGNLDNALKSHSKALERMETEKQVLKRQLEQAEIDFTHALSAKSKELKSAKTQLASQLQHFTSESTKHQELIQRAEAAYLQRQEVLLRQIEHLKGYATKQQSDRQRCQALIRTTEKDMHDKIQALSMQLEKYQQYEKKFYQHERVLKQMDLLFKRLSPVQVVYPVRRFDHQALQPYLCKPKSQIEFFDEIGCGSYGTVSVVKFDGRMCIGKRLYGILRFVSKQTPSTCQESFIRECVLMSQTDHPNVVKFLGVHYGKDQFDLTLLMEQLHTDLHKYLDSTPDLLYTVKVSILHDVSCGLLYLHKKCSIIHRDLSAANILLTAKKQAKIADLGMSKVFSVVDCKKMTGPGTLAYMSPEALQEKPYDSGLDIFSFGVVTLFIAIQIFPEYSHENIPDTIVESEVYRRRVWFSVMEQKQPELSSLIHWCLRSNSKQRPSTTCLNIYLREMKTDCV